MKNYYNYILIIVLLSCNSMDQPDLQVDDPLDIQANLLEGTWILKDETSAVRDGSVVSDFKNIILLRTEVTIQHQIQLMLMYGLILELGNSKMVTEAN